MRLRLALLSLAFSLAACSSEPEAPPAPPPEQAGEEGDSAEAEAAEPEAEAKEEKQPIAATIGALKGKATVNKKPAKSGQALSAGDVIATKKGELDIHMNDGSRVRLGPGARLEIGKISDEEGVSVSLALGKLYSWITPGTPYEVVTGNAVAGVRGTKFFIEEKKRKSYFCVCEGTIGVKGPKDDDEVALEAGYELYARRKKAGEPKESADKMIGSINAIFDQLKPAADESEGAQDGDADGGEEPDDEGDDE